MIGTVNPEMIRTARLAAGKSQKEVADRLGIKQPTYSKIESGYVSAVDHLSALSSALGVPPTFFEQTDRIWGTASPHHRRRKSLSPKRLQELEAQLNIVRLQVKRLSANVEISPLFDLPVLDLDVVGSPSAAAREVRRLWRMPSGPVASVTRVLEDAGIVIVERPFPERLDAISVFGPGESPIILLNSSFPTARKRQTLAHELGHLTMHLSEITDDPEGEANEFAREFLMPADEIRVELRHLRLQALPDLKRRWKCSMRNFVYHARALDEITADQARYLFMKLNRDYGAKNEPIDLPDEPPTLMSELLEGHLRDLGYTADQTAGIARADAETFKSEYRLSARHLRVV